MKITNPVLKFLFRDVCNGLPKQMIQIKLSQPSGGCGRSKKAAGHVPFLKTIKAAENPFGSHSCAFMTICFLIERKAVDLNIQYQAELKACLFPFMKHQSCPGGSNNRTGSLW